MFQIAMALRATFIYFKPNYFDCFTLNEYQYIRSVQGLKQNFKYGTVYEY